MYNQVAQRLKQLNPALKIEGHHHMPDEPLPTIANALQAVYMVLIALAIPAVGTWVFDLIGVEMPALLLKAHENQLSSMFLIFYIGNMVSSNMLKSGAFEIKYNDKLVWSKMATGELPTWPVLLEGLQRHGAVPQEAVQRALHETEV